MIKDEILEFWDRLWKKDDYYASYDIPRDSDGISHLLRFAVEGMEGNSLLEVGSGPSTRGIPLAKEQGLNLTLLDRLESAQSLARKRAERYGISCDYLLGDARAIPLDDNSYDFVVSIGLNEHFFGDDRQRVFTEMSRVTRDGGRTIVIVPNKLGTIRLEQAIKEKLGTWVYGPTDLFDYRELSSRMEACSFKQVKTYGVSIITSTIRLLPQKIQRRIFSSDDIWDRLVHMPGNLNLTSPLNRYFGEEIMAVGYK